MTGGAARKVSTTEPGVQFIPPIRSMPFVVFSKGPGPGALPRKLRILSETQPLPGFRRNHNLNFPRLYCGRARRILSKTVYLAFTVRSEPLQVPLYIATFSRRCSPSIYSRPRLMKRLGRWPSALALPYSINSPPLADPWVPRDGHSRRHQGKPHSQSGLHLGRLQIGDI